MHIVLPMRPKVPVPGIPHIPEKIGHQYKGSSHNCRCDRGLFCSLFPVNADYQYGEKRHDDGIGEHDQGKDQPRGPQRQQYAADADQRDDDPYGKESLPVI